MAKGNPFSLTFSKIPTTSIDRTSEQIAIVEDFLDDDPVSQIYMITGVRASGKTVCMASIKEQIRTEDGWIIVDLSSANNFLEELAASLYSHELLHALFLTAKLDLTILGIGISIEGAAPVSSINVALDRMFSVIRKAHKRVLITIDEVTNRPTLKEFTLAFSTWMQESYPVFLLMTGLPESLSSIQTAKGQTFLLRAPKRYLSPLNTTLITKAYMDIFEIPFQEAEQMAVLVKGYSYAFQILGYYLWEARKKNEKATYLDVLDLFDVTLATNSYDLIWRELSEKDQEIVKGLAQIDTIKDVSEVRELLGIESPQLFHRYKKRLLERGIITEKGYAKMEFTLPRFKEYVRAMDLEN